jgi:hypothetical protein
LEVQLVDKSGSLSAFGRNLNPKFYVGVLLFMKSIFKTVIPVLFLTILVGCGKSNSATTASDVYTVSNVQEISLAQQDAGFNIKLPNDLPKDYKFQSVKYIPEKQAITIQYVWNDLDFTGEMLFLTQQVVNPKISYAKDVKVEDILLGNLWAKFVQGSDNNGAWQNDAPVYWLRWEAHGYFFTLTYTFNETTSKGFIGKEKFLKLAEQLLW